MRRALFTYEQTDAIDVTRRGSWCAVTSGTSKQERSASELARPNSAFPVCPGFSPEGMQWHASAKVRPGSIKIHPMHGVAPRIGS
jgi:hypothetical protein